MTIWLGFTHFFVPLQKKWWDALARTPRGAKGSRFWVPGSGSGNFLLKVATLWPFWGGFAVLPTPEPDPPPIAVTNNCLCESCESAPETSFLPTLGYHNRPGREGGIGFEAHTAWSLPPGATWRTAARRRWRSCGSGCRSSSWTGRGCRARSTRSRIYPQAAATNGPIQINPPNKCIHPLRWGKNRRQLPYNTLTCNILQLSKFITNLPQTSFSEDFG